jgi:beta-alanine degradation protein BauB
MPAALATTLIDNESVRVTEWRFPPGGATGHHRHHYEYVVVPLTTGTLTIVGPAGVTTADLVTGQPYHRPVGVEHDVQNLNPTEFVFIEIEIKR